jgi:hypothetical protein
MARRLGGTQGISRFSTVVVLESIYASACAALSFNLIATLAKTYIVQSQFMAVAAMGPAINVVAHVLCMGSTQNEIGWVIVQ